MYLLLRDTKLLLRDITYKLYIKTMYLLLRVVKLHSQVYLPLRDAKLLLRDSINKLYINIVYLLLRDAKLKGFHLQVKNKHLLLVDANLLPADSILPIAILRFLLPYALIIERFLIF